MFSSAIRRSWLLKIIAQQAATTSTTATTPEASSPQSSVAPPPAFQASAIFTFLPSVFNSQSVQMINNIVSTLNIAMHYASNGQFNWNILRNTGFQVDPSGTPNTDTKNLINLSLLIYRTLLNSGNQPPNKISAQQIAQWTNMISTSQPLLNLSQLNPSGIIAQKLGGSLKDMLINYLRYLALYNPAQ